MFILNKKILFLRRAEKNAKIKLPMQSLAKKMTTKKFSYFDAQKSCETLNYL